MKQLIELTLDIPRQTAENDNRPPIVTVLPATREKQKPQAVSEKPVSFRKRVFGFIGLLAVLPML